jgi:hypothetical protein
MAASISDILKFSGSLQSALARLTVEEKLALIEYLAQSVRSAEATPSLEVQRETLARLRKELAALPLESPDDGFSGADHDDVLYGKRS